MMEVLLAEHNTVAKALPSDRTDQPFAYPSWGVRRCRPVTNEIAGSLFPTACFRDLICYPFCSGVSCDAKPQKFVVGRAP